MRVLSERQLEAQLGALAGPDAVLAGLHRRRGLAIWSEMPRAPGVCGEHGGDPDSVHFFHDVGLDNVSCSPFRVPVARLEAGRAALAAAGSDSR